MPITWSVELDQLLFRSVETDPDATWGERAADLAAKVGIPITEDMARNRYGRLKEQVELFESSPMAEAVTVPPVPEGDYVGFDMAYFDIEATGLGGYGSEMTVACIVDQFGSAEWKTKFDFEQRSVLDDRGLCLWLRDRLEEFDMIVAWYGTMYDIPYLNARLVIHGERPMERRKIIDPCFKARGGRYGLKMGGSKLSTVGKALKSPYVKPDVEWDTFRLAGMGDDEALAEVVDRCRTDCYLLRDIFGRFRKVIRNINE